MITLTRLSGSTFVLNCDLIERIDNTPDTVISLVDGKKYVVAESAAEVIASVRAYRSRLIADSDRVLSGTASSIHRLTVVASPASPAGPAESAGES